MSMFPKNKIALQIKSNLPFAADVSIMNAFYNPNSQQPNGDYSYVFDLSTETFIGVSQVTLDYYTTNISIITSINKPLLNNSIAGVIDALNSCGVGVFFYSGTTIFTYNNGSITFTDIIVS